MPQLGDDHSASIATNVDDVVEVVVGVVIGLSGFFLVAHCNALAAFGALLIAYLGSFSFDSAVFIFHLDGDRNAWRRMR